MSREKSSDSTATLSFTSLPTSKNVICGAIGSFFRRSSICPSNASSVRLEADALKIGEHHELRAGLVHLAEDMLAAKSSAAGTVAVPNPASSFD